MPITIEFQKPIGVVLPVREFDPGEEIRIAGKVTGLAGLGEPLLLVILDITDGFAAMHIESRTNLIGNYWFDIALPDAVSEATVTISAQFWTGWEQRFIPIGIGTTAPVVPPVLPPAPSPSPIPPIPPPLTPSPTGELVVIAQADSVEAFQKTKPSVKELPKGSMCYLTIRTSVPVAPFFDLAGIEYPVQWFGEQLLFAGATVLDVYSTDWNEVMVEMEADPIHVVGLLWAIAAVLVGVGFIIASLKLEILKDLFEELKEIAPEMTKWLAIGAIALIGFMMLGRRRKRLR